MKNIITVDGPAGAGKGTLTIKLGEYLNFATLDTGSIYRAITLYLVEELGDKIKDISEDEAVEAAEYLSETGKVFAYSKDERIRDKLTSNYVAKVAAVPGVRKCAKEYQRKFAFEPPELQDGSRAKGVIIEGRDIGTVVCPEAPVKLFLTADVEERAKRRWLEYKEKGIEASFDEILEHIKARDEADMNRKASPLRPADDAVAVNTTEMTREEVFDYALKCVDSKLDL